MPSTAPIFQTRPISDLRTHLSEIEEQARETGEPIVLTRNGKASLVVIDSEVYNQQRELERIRLKLREAEIEAKHNPKTYTLEEVKARMKRNFELLAEMGYGPDNA